MSKNNSFIAPDYNNHSPLSWYQAAAQQDNFIVDAAQQEAIIHLDDLWQQLIVFKEKRSKFLGKSFRTPKIPMGIYMWGGVGRGKSFLMDVFYNCLPYQRKRRVHFHVFMVEVHQRMKTLKAENDPLVAVAKAISQETRVLCFDEFHVSDIADAMILGRLLENLLSNGVVLVLTSNFAPDDLYLQGQNRYSFLPTIALLKKQFKILNVDGGEDYRLRSLTEAKIFYKPANEQNERRLSELFQKLTYNEEVMPKEIEILGRKLLAKQHSKNCIWFDFRTLCFGPRSQQDYLYLAENYCYVFISGLEKLTPNEKNEARRLTWLIDVFYDFRVKVCMTSAVDIEEIYTEGDFAFEFSRTASRMIEMQSEEYLQLAHLTLKEYNNSL